MSKICDPHPTAYLPGKTSRQSFDSMTDDVEAAIRNAISLGGDSDTLACIAGAIAHAYFGELPAFIVDETRRRLPDEFLTVIAQFNERYGC